MARSVAYRVLEESDYEDVWNIVLEIYRALETTVTIFNFSTGDLRRLLQKSVKDAIAQRVSVGAFDKKTNKLIGIVLGSLGRLHKLAVDSDTGLSQQMRQHMAISRYFVGDDPPATFGTREYLRIFMLLSYPEYNREEIETELCKRCAEIALKEGCKKILSVVSSAQSRKILKKFEYITEKTVNVRDYEDPVSGRKILADLPQGPDESISLEVKYLCN